MTTAENIQKLEPHQIFVFGSNLAGRHAGGAAHVAREMFGAEESIGEGMTGKCYALPTLGKKLEKRNDEQLTMSIRRFFKCARANPDKTFLLTRVGCGIAGYEESYISALFKAAPPNVVKPKGW